MIFVALWVGSRRSRSANAVLILGLQLPPSPENRGHGDLSLKFAGHVDPKAFFVVPKTREKKRRNNTGSSVKLLEEKKLVVAKDYQPWRVVPQFGIR